MSHTYDNSGFKFKNSNDSQERYVKLLYIGSWSISSILILILSNTFLSPSWCAGGNPESNTLISDQTTVICLDDYHSLDRNGRKKEGVTALDPKAQNFDLMYDQIKSLKEGGTADKPIYNHVTGLLDPAETIKAPNVSLSSQAISKNCAFYFKLRYQKISMTCFAILEAIQMEITKLMIGMISSSYLIVLR